MINLTSSSTWSWLDLSSLVLWDAISMALERKQKSPFFTFNPQNVYPLPRNLALPLAFSTAWPLTCEIRRKGLRKLSRWTKMMLNPKSSEVTQKCHHDRYFLFLRVSAPPHLWEIRIHVLGCNWRVRDKFKELPHSHHGNAILQKEICQRRCLWELCEGEGCYPNLFTDKQIKFTIAEPRVSVSLSQTVQRHGSLLTV